MTVLIIIAAIVLILLVILEMPVTAYIRYYGGKLDVKAKYGFITVYPHSEQKSKKHCTQSDECEAEHTEENQDNSETSSSEQAAPRPQKEPTRVGLGERLNSLLDDLNEKKNAVQLAAELLEKSLKRLGKRVKLYGLVIDFAAADEDACQAAISYGKLGAAVYNAIAFLQCYVRLGIRSVTVDCLYNTPSDQSRYDGELKIRLRPISVLHALLTAFFKYMANAKRYSPIFEAFKQ